MTLFTRLLVCCPENKPVKRRRGTQGLLFSQLELSCGQRHKDTFWYRMEFEGPELRCGVWSRAQGEEKILSIVDDRIIWPPKAGVWVVRGGTWWMGRFVLNQSDSGWMFLIDVRRDCASLPLFFSLCPPPPTLSLSISQSLRVVCSYQCSPNIQ